MTVIADSNIFYSALITPNGYIVPAGSSLQLAPNSKFKIQNS